MEEKLAREKWEKREIEKTHFVQTDKKSGLKKRKTEDLRQCHDAHTGTKGFGLTNHNFQTQGHFLTDFNQLIHWRFQWGTRTIYPDLGRSD